MLSKRSSSAYNERAELCLAEPAAANAAQEENMTKKFVLTMENGDVIQGELYPDKAPETVANFEKLANDGFYDGLTFHRVIPGFMLQGGDPTGTGMGGPGHTIHGEFAANGFKQNDLKHERGVLSMARTSDPNSAGSQFFIMHKNAPHLDGSYAAFGKVTDGMSGVDRIAETQTNYADKPLQDQVIKSIRVTDED